MTISLYNLSVSSYLQILGGVVTCLDQGLAHCRASGLDPDEVAATRLCADMNPFDFQVQAITHHSVGAIAAVKHGSYFAKPKVPPVGYGELQKMILTAQAALRQVSPAEIDGCVGGEVIFRYQDLAIPYAVEDFLLSFSLPNFYFHATTAYDILRMKGVLIGKVDYLGPLRIKS